MQGGFKNTYDAVKPFSETDFRGDLAKFDKPTLIIHGEWDQIVPIDEAGHASKKLVPHAKLIVYEGAPHGLPETPKDRINSSAERRVGKACVRTCRFRWSPTH